MRACRRLRLQAGEHHWAEDQGIQETPALHLEEGKIGLQGEQCHICSCNTDFRRPVPEQMPHGLQHSASYTGL